MIALVSYGLGNIKAFANIYKEANIDFVIASDAATLKAADKIILPGVGSFDHAMKRLNASGMADVLNERVLGDGIPVLGVCVGMQILADRSDEGGEPGLSWIKGTVRDLGTRTAAQRERLPHMGWNTIDARSDVPLFANLDNDLGFYFLHSYYFECALDAEDLATVDYGGQFSCAVGRGNIFGVQFHPEKSHHNGVQLLRNFAAL